MERDEFSEIRRHLGKTQNQLARLLGASSKAIQSFEQGWRNVSVYTERQLLLLLALKHSLGKKTKPCWVIRKCDPKARQDCPAWEFRAGHICWFINGTSCQGKAQENWTKKMKICRQCRVFRSMLPVLPGTFRGATCKPRLKDS